MKPYSQLPGKFASRVTSREIVSQDNAQPRREPKPLVVQQADEIALLYNATTDSRDPEKIRQRLLQLKTRFNDPAWRAHLCGRKVI